MLVLVGRSGKAEYGPTDEPKEDALDELDSLVVGRNVSGVKRSGWAGFSFASSTVWGLEAEVRCSAVRSCVVSVSVRSISWANCCCCCSKAARVSSACFAALSLLIAVALRCTSAISIIDDTNRLSCDAQSVSHLAHQ